MELKNEAEVLRAWSERQKSPRLAQAWQKYWGFYATWLGGVCLDPRWMMVPLDDHLVHRGDGVFEAIRINHGCLYLLEPHLERFERSAKAIHLQLPISLPELRELVRNAAAKILSSRSSEDQQGTSILRLFCSRGAGGFGTNPAESVGAQIWIVVTAMAPVSVDQQQKGVTACRAETPLKSDFYAQIKSCNYLPNVLMKWESVQRGFDFAVGFDAEGFLCEGPTENIILINKLGRLSFPNRQKILSGTTMLRLFDLVRAQGLLPIERDAGLTETDLLQAQGVFFVGTTLEVVPCCRFETHNLPIHPLTSKLQQLIQNDQRPGSPQATPIK